MMDLIELFSGAGGAALGLKASGIAGGEHDVTLGVEIDAAAVETARAGGLFTMQGDVREVFRTWDLAGVGGAFSHGFLWASPPCQAFSTAGGRKGSRDERNGWPWTLDAIDAAKPAVVVCENVPGLMYHRKKAGCGKGLNPKPDDCPGCYFEHYLLGEFRLRYDHVAVWKLNAADYGVPQARRRVFIVASHKPLPPPPPPTHGELQLAHAKWVTGEYWRDRGLLAVGEPTRSESKLMRLGSPDRALLPWVTMWDALGRETFTDYHPTMRVAHASASVRVAPRTPHETSPTIGGKGTIYLKMEKGGRPDLLHRPSPTVTATEYKGTNGKETSGWTMNGGPARASDVAWLGAGKRRLSIRECAILQGFPADWPWSGKVKEQYMQVGNAVPPRLAEVIARQLTPYL